MKRRREFLKTAGAMAAGGLVIPTSCTPEKSNTNETPPPAPPKDKDIGIQIYTLRDEIENDGLEITMEMVAAAGYKWIEPYGYENGKFLDKTPAEFKQMLADLGMRAPSVHSVTEVSSEGGKDAIVDQMKATAEDAIALGAEYMVWAYLKPEDRTSMEDYKRHIETWNKFSEVCKEVGIQFAYHNHDFEFSEKLNGKLIFDLIMELTDPDKVVLQLDIGNMYIAGAKALDIVNKYPGRFENIHVKDMIKSESEGHGFESTILGTGQVGTKEVTDISRQKGGTKVFIIEQESYQGKTPLECMKEDLAIMKNWGY